MEVKVKKLCRVMTTGLMAISLLGLFIPGCGTNTSIVKGNLYRVSNAMMRAGKFAILPFKSASEGKTMTNRVSTDGNAIADILTIQMLYKNYTVLERDQVQRILQEVNLSQIYNTADSDQKETEMKDIGKMLGVDFIIYGSVIQYEYVAHRGIWHISMGMTTRIADVETGKVVFVCTATHQGNNIATTLDGISLAITDALTEEKVYVWQ